MGTEAQVKGYEMRVYEDIRFQQLEAFESKIFDDSHISLQELQTAQRLENDVLREFLVMGDVVKQLESTNDKRLPAAKAMLSHLHRCFVKIDYIESKARAERERSAYGESLTRQRQKENRSENERNLILAFLAGHVGLAKHPELMGLFTDEDKRMKARLQEMAGELGKMPESERGTLADKAMELVTWLSTFNKKEMNNQLKKLTVSHKQRGQRSS